MNFLIKHGTHNNMALKIAAMALFIVFPILGFVLGVQYQREMSALSPQPGSREATVAATNNADILKKYTNDKLKISFYYPGNFSIKENTTETGSSIEFRNKEGVAVMLEEGVFGGDNKPLKTTPVVVDGQTLQKLDYRYELDPSPDGIEQEVVQLSKNPPYYIRITSWYTQPRRSLTKDEMLVFDTILATIKPSLSGSSATDATSSPSATRTNLLKIDSIWNKYTNRQMGFSINIPQQAVSFYGDCIYTTENGDHSYRPVFKAVPLQVLENTNEAYITGAYNYILSGQSREGSRSFYSSCDKTDITLDKVLRLQKNESVSPELKLFSQKATNDQELAQFIKNNYGKDCVLGKKSQTKQAGVYSVEIGGMSSPESGKDCFVNYAYTIRYSPAKSLVVAWNLGQACNFAFPTQTDCLDEKVSSSFQFE